MLAMANGTNIKLSLIKKFVAVSKVSYVLSVIKSSVVVSWLVSSSISSWLVSRLVIECFVGVVSSVVHMVMGGPSLR